MAVIKTFYWYDYETYGTEPMFDRLVQFAGVRTDEQLNIVGEPLTLYVKPANDFLPNADSSMITGISPQKALAEGLPEAEAIRRINQEFSQPGTCVVGYNNIRFDDEFTRYTLYRSLLDPYAREWRNGNSRWDLLDVARATRALRPEGINWPTNAEGRPSIRLEDLSVANDIKHESAHDALSDVYATIAVAKLILEKQPKIFEYCLKSRNKQHVLKMLNLKEQKWVVHASGMYPVEHGNIALVIPVATHPTNKNAVVVYDLRYDPSSWINLSAKEIHKRIFTAKDDLPEGVERIPLKTIQANKCPIIAPFTTLTSDAAKQYKIDLNKSRQHYDSVRSSPGLREKIQKVFSSTEFIKRTDPDCLLYGGAFFSDADRVAMNHIHTLAPSDLPDHTPAFSDERLAELYFRYKARNWPELLSDSDKQRWKEFRLNRIENPVGSHLAPEAYFQRLKDLKQDPERSEAQIQLLGELEVYAKEIMSGP